MLSNCTSTNNKSASQNFTNNTKVLAIVNNKNSMTASLRKLNYNFSISILYNGLESEQYKRFVTINLESTPVIVAVSSTSPKNKTFYNILSNSKNNSIGIKLFAAHNKIKRDPNIIIYKTKISDVKSYNLHNYLLSLGYKNDQTIIKRTSIFVHETETMQLTEYILPSIVKFI
ncbi:MAG: hypothetical protein ACK5Z5_03775 [Neisseriaceae bacterium]